jgi:hypothetical protein
VEALAVIAVILTVLGGSTLFALYVAAGGFSRPAPTQAVADLPARRVQEAPVPARATSHFSVARAGVHGVLGISGAIAIVFAVVGNWRTAAIIALLFLLAAATIGLTMFVPWARERNDRAAQERPEQKLPLVVVLGHGLGALVTLVAVVVLVLRY